MKRAIYAAMAVAGCWFAYHEYGAQHVGAPPLPYSCPHGSHVTRWWVKDSDPTGRGASGTLEWHGWREIASCSASLHATT